MAKKRLNLINKVTAAGGNDYIVMNTSDGKTVQIKKTDLLPTVNEMVNGILSAEQFNNTVMLKGAYTSNSDCNNITSTGFYGNTTGNGTGNSNWPAGYGFLLVLRTYGNYGWLQIHFDTFGKIHVRPKWGTAWSSWKSVSLT